MSSNRKVGNVYSQLIEPRNPEMMSRQKRHPQEAKISMSPSSSDEEDGCDVEKTSSLLPGREGSTTGEISGTREEEQEFSSDEDEEGSVPAESQSSDGEEDSEASDEDEEEDPDHGSGSSEIQTREDIKKGEFPC